MPRQLRLSLLLLMLIAVDALGGPGAWTTNGPYGGTVTSIAVDPNNLSTLFVGTKGPQSIRPHGGGVFTTTNGSFKWTPINTGLPARDILFVHAVDDGSGAHRTVLYAGTYGDGIFQSDNGGATWVPRNGGLPHGYWPVYLSALAVAPSNYLTLYASRR